MQIQLPPNRRVRFVAGRVPDMKSLPLEVQLGAVFFVESEEKNFRAVTYDIRPESMYAEEESNGTLVGSDEEPIVQNEDYHASPAATGTISGPADSAVVDSPATFTVAASAFPVFVVLRKGGVDQGARTSKGSAGTVNLTPTSTGSFTARMYSALTGGQLIDDTPSFTVAAAPDVALDRYFGTTADAGPLDNSELLALSHDTGSTKAKTFTTGAITDQYVYYAYPASLGDLSTIYLDGNTSINQLGAFIKTTQSVTPAGGSATNYNVYRSENLLGVGAPIAFAFA